MRLSNGEQGGRNDDGSQTHVWQKESAVVNQPRLPVTMEGSAPFVWSSHQFQSDCETATVPKGLWVVLSKCEPCLVRSSGILVKGLEASGLPVRGSGSSVHWSALSTVQAALGLDGPRNLSTRGQ